MFAISFDRNKDIYGLVGVPVGLLACRLVQF